MVPHHSREPRLAILDGEFAGIATNGDNDIRGAYDDDSPEASRVLVARAANPAHDVSHVPLKKMEGLAIEFPDSTNLDQSAAPIVG